MPEDPNVTTFRMQENVIAALKDRVDWQTRALYSKDQEIEKLRDDIAFLQEFIDKQKRYKEMV